MFASRPLEVCEISRGDTVKEGISASPLASCASSRSIKQAHRGATSVGSSSQGAALVGKRVQGNEPRSTRRRRKAKGTGASEQETGGAVRPCKTNSPSGIGKGSVFSLSLASEGDTQTEWGAGFARGTWFAKVGQVAREANDRRCVVFMGPKVL